MIQAQRDYFGAHTYNRVDRPGTFHTEWLTVDDEVTSNPV
jgi:6-phosphogluconate dehydrogenase